MNALLETVISLTYLYVLVSLLLSFLSEAVASYLRRRELFLKDSIDRILNDPNNKNYGELLYEHPLVWSLRKNEKRFPTYISAEIFSETLIDLLKRDASLPHLHRTTDGKLVESHENERSEFQILKEGIHQLHDSDFKTRVRTFLDSSLTISEFQKYLMDWYNEYQMNISQWYAKKSKKLLFFLAIPLVIFLNFDSLHVFKRLMNDEVIRTVLVADAKAFAENEQQLKNYGLQNDTTGVMLQTSPQEHLAKFKEIQEVLYSANLPIGWSCAPEENDTGVNSIEQTWNCIKSKFCSSSIMDKLMTLIGWFVSIVAISFGAPFWFDILKKLFSVKERVNASK